MPIGDCGYEVTFIVGRFALCSVRGCDTKAGEKCGRCGSADLYDFTAPLVPEGAKACRSCGAVRWSATQ